MLANMNARGLYPIADVVVNHRSGTTGWVDLLIQHGVVKQFVEMMMRECFLCRL